MPSTTTRRDVLFLTALESAADVGQYGAAYRFLDAFTVIPMIAMSVLGAGDGAQRRRAGRRSSSAATARPLHLVIVLAVGVALIGAMTACARAARAARVR